MKKILISVILTTIFTISVFAITKTFNIDTSKLSIVSNLSESLESNFNKDYKLQVSIDESNKALEDEIKELTKKTTYLLLGEFNNENESSEKYYQRREDFLNMIYSPEIPKKEDGSFDEESQEYKDSNYAGWLAGLFLDFDEMKAIYNQFGDIKITYSDNMIMSVISIPNVKIKVENEDNPMEYKTIKTNLINYYFYKKNKDVYQLYSAMGETVDDLSLYFTEIENEEQMGTFNAIESYDSELSKIYDFSKLNALTKEQLNNVYEKNKNNVVIINSYYNNMEVAQGHGIFINDGIILTSWSFIEKSLRDAQYLSIRDNNGDNFNIDGIITINQDADVALIKLKDKVERKVILSSLETLNIEDPAISITSKGGVGLSIQSGIVISKDGYIQSSIPLVESDEGSPLFNINGEIIGMNTSKQINTNISLSIGVDILKEIQNKFNSINFANINVITFKELKEKYYYTKLNEEIIKNNISKTKWKKYKKIGNVEDNINLELVKANEVNGSISLRYKNNLSDFASSMQFASSFKKELINQNYKEILNSSSKCIYQSKDYQVVIMEEFDYLIIVMVKL